MKCGNTQLYLGRNRESTSKPRVAVLPQASPRRVLKPIATSKTKTRWSPTGTTASRQIVMATFEQTGTIRISERSVLRETNPIFCGRGTPWVCEVTNPKTRNLEKVVHGSRAGRTESRSVSEMPTTSISCTNPHEAGARSLPWVAQKAFCRAQEDRRGQPAFRTPRSQRGR